MVTLEILQDAETMGLYSNEVLPIFRDEYVAYLAEQGRYDLLNLEEILEASNPDVVDSLIEMIDDNLEPSFETFIDEEGFSNAGYDAVFSYFGESRQVTDTVLRWETQKYLEALKAIVKRIEGTLS